MKLTRLNDLIEDGEVVKGGWELLSGHELGYRGEGRDEEIRFKAPIIAAEPDALVAAATVRQDDQTVITRILKLTGRWKTDGANRLVFEAERSRGRVDRLTLTGTWKVNDSNQITYTYRSERPAAGSRRATTRSPRQQTHQLIFKGHWEITDRRQITYLLEGDSDSAFRFRGAFQTPSILAKTGQIRFAIGAEVSGRAGGMYGRGARTRRRTAGAAVQSVTLFGTWKLGRDLALSLELDGGSSGAGSRRKRALRFGAEWTYKKSGTLGAQLKSERGKPLGVELVWTRSFLTARGEWEIFARMLRSAEEKGIEAGGRLRW